MRIEGKPKVISAACLENHRLGFTILSKTWKGGVADIVPDFLRGRYFSTRNLTMGFGTLIFATVAGWLSGDKRRWPVATEDAWAPMLTRTRMRSTILKRG